MVATLLVPAGVGPSSEPGWHRLEQRLAPWLAKTRADRFVALGSLDELSWQVMASALPLLVIRWSAGPARPVPAVDLLQIEHPVQPGDVPVVRPVLRAIATRLGVDAGLPIATLDMRAARGLMAPMRSPGQS
jgi:hypothetical protein